VEAYGSASDFLSRVAGMYRVDIWALAPRYGEVLCDAGLLPGLVQRDSKGLSVRTISIRRLLVHELAYETAYLYRAPDQAHRPVIIYIGHYRSAGEPADTKGKLRQHLVV
jgi:hypothetical protein